MGTGNTKEMSTAGNRGSNEDDDDDNGIEDAKKASFVPSDDPSLLSRAKNDPRSMTDQEWREVLSPQQYRVARKSGTERAFTGDLWDNKKKGEMRRGNLLSKKRSVLHAHSQTTTF